MIFNSLQSVAPQKRQKLLMLLILIIAPLFTCLLLLWIVPLLINNQGIQTKQIIAVLAITITMLWLTMKIVFYLLDYQLKSKRSIKIDAITNNENAIITCSIENLGRKRITPKNIYLLVDKGLLKNGVYEFSYLLKHEEGENDCNLSKRCKTGGLGCYPTDLVEDDFKDIYNKLIKLKHLSTESILFIDPGESFSEDVVLVLSEPGVYRATVVWTAINEDCICSSKQFIINESI
jgi:hypothetical protein